MSVGCKSCIEGVSDSSNPHGNRALSLYLRIYLWASIKVDWRFLLKPEVNDKLFAIVSRKLSIFFEQCV